MKPSRHDRVYTRQVEPGTYWFHVVVITVLGVAIVGAAVSRLVHVLANPD